MRLLKRHADVGGEHAAAGGRGDEVGWAEADMLGERQQQDIEEHHRQAGEQILHRMHRPSCHQFQHEHGHEGERQEQHGVFRRARHQIVEVDRLIELHAELIRPEAVDAGGGEAPGAAVRCAPDAARARSP